MRQKKIYHKYSGWFVLGLLLLMGCHSESLQTGYVQNQTLFDAYEGTKEVQAKLKQMQQAHQYVLDSMALYLTGRDSLYRITQYQRLTQEYQTQEQNYVQQSSEQLWHQINTYMTAYGKDHGYDYIFGAVGNGSLMYALDSKDITTEVSHYINQRYAGE